MKWSKLSMTEKNEVIKMAVAQGIRDIPSIKNLYEESVNGSRRFEDGGGLSSLPSNWTMQDEAKYRNWKENLPVNLRNTNDNDYDMRRAYLAGMHPSLEDDGYYHLGSRDPKTGRILKSPHHPTYLQAVNTDARMGYYPAIDKQGVTYTDTWEGNKYENGGSIHIKPSKRGTFTAAATKHGKSVQEFASQVLSHPENYSLTMRKKANFARNASHWKH